MLSFLPLAVFVFVVGAFLLASRANYRRRQRKGSPVVLDLDPSTAHRARQLREDLERERARRAALDADTKELASRLDAKTTALDEARERIRSLERELQRQRAAAGGTVLELPPPKAKGSR